MDNPDKTLEDAFFEHEVRRGRMRTIAPALSAGSLPSADPLVPLGALLAQVYLAKQAFDQQFHYAIFYAYLRLKEQEIRNIGW